MLVLTTDRLRLRWFAPGDEAYVLEQLQQDSWKLNINDPGVRDLGAAKFWMEEKLLSQYWGKGLGLWAVERTSDGVLMGMAGVLQRDYLPAPDIGYAFLPRYWGQGYAREAARACLAYARDVLGEPRLMASTAPFNEASGRVLEDLGMRYLETQQFAGVEGLSKVYSMGEPAPAGDEQARIADLLKRFFAVFNNQQGRCPSLAALPYMLLPQAIISRADDAGLHPMSVEDFVRPRAELLRPGGRLQQFDEAIIEQRIDHYGRIAQVWARYRKQGLLDGQAFEAEGVKTLQLLNTGRRWQIAALAWEDLL
ncbi:GNAT family N-acetyltransferase [Roseateles oligotrophus]|uniref:GNAT family N-acetyltransferase n=1 Tax=Roseateles oligotrophus TaxID=1769250 RepID=A0ABT2YJP7_9BURK|nr:GNAT family N-acetyltransferase [Roseateles oligotrophus]MCV2370286.1 GNAT family N-acetyltransferase [Roseateles oligotrophus]